jgi:hypothetical protein
MTRRWNIRRRPNSVEALVASLPDELRSFDSWYYPEGLREYMRALSNHVGADHQVAPVMNHAGLSAAEWFRHMLLNKSNS